MDSKLRTLVVCQNKGGEGKTTLTRLIAEFASRQGLRVLLIDMDAQCNLSKRVLAMDADGETGGAIPPIHPDYEGEANWDGRSSIADAYDERVNLYGIVPYPTENPLIEIVPGSAKRMRTAELVNQRDVLEKITNRLKQVMGFDNWVENSYDLVVIDTPPSKGPLVQSAIRAATHMLIPTQMAQQSIEGLSEMIMQWRRENRTRSAAEQLDLIGVLPNKVRPVAVQDGVHLALKRDPAIAPFLIPLRIGERTVFAETDHPNAKPKSVFDLRLPDKARTEAEEVCAHIMQRMGFTSETSNAAVSALKQAV